MISFSNVTYFKNFSEFGLILFLAHFFVLQLDVDKGYFKQKALDGQSHFSRSMQKLTATGVITHYGLAGGKPMRLVYHVDGDRRCVEFYNDDWENSEEGSYCRILVFTSSYHFDLTKKKPDSVFSIGTASDKLSESEKMRLRLFKNLVVDNFLFAPMKVAGYTASEILAEDGWQILDVKSVDEKGAGVPMNQVTVESNEPENNIKNFHFSVSPDHFYGISGYEAIFGNSDSEKHAGKVEYLNEVSDGIPLFQVNRSMTQTRNGIAKTFNESVVFDSIQQGCRDEVFSLGYYFNASDPFVQPRKIWPFLVLIGLGVVAALGFYRLWVKSKTI